MAHSISHHSTASSDRSSVSIPDESEFRGKDRFKPRGRGLSEHKVSYEGKGRDTRRGRSRGAGSDFSVRTRQGKIDLDKKIEEKVQDLFEQFKTKILLQQNDIANEGEDTSGFRVSVHLSTRIVTIIDDQTETISYVDLNALEMDPEESGLPDRETAVYKIRRLVQDMQNELVHEGVMEQSSASPVIGNPEYSPYCVGSQNGINAFSSVLNSVGSVTKTRMLTVVQNFSEDDYGRILGPHYKAINQRAVRMIEADAQSYARESMNQLARARDELVLKRKTAAGRVNNKDEVVRLDKKISKLRKKINDKSMLSSKGTIQLTAMIRARAEYDLAKEEKNFLASYGTVMPSIEKKNFKQRKAKEYVHSLNGYFDMQRANEKMGERTTQGPVTTQAEKNLATLIVATAVFSKTVDEDGSVTDKHKGEYQEFIFSQGGQGGLNPSMHLGAIGEVFRLQNTINYSANNSIGRKTVKKQLRALGIPHEYDRVYPLSNRPSSSHRRMHNEHLSYRRDAYDAYDESISSTDSDSDSGD